MSVKKTFGVGILIFLSFLLTSAEYMTWWMPTLVPNFSSTAADILSEGIGYLFQVLGLLIMSYLIYRKSDHLNKQSFFWIMILLDYLAALLACTFQSAVFILVFGFSMNLFHGIIAGWYLMLLAKYVPQNKIGLTFGLSYALASLAYYLLSQISGLFHTSSAIFGIYFIIGIATVLASEYVLNPQAESDDRLDETLHNNLYGEIIVAPVTRKLLSIACIMVILLSLTRGLGFYFPSSDLLLNGVDPVFTRCFYAVGLILAGIITDRSRRYGSVMCLISLVFPFIVLSLINEPDTETLFWIIGYILFGFLAVFRVTLFQDISRREEAFLYLSGMGLAMGRIGDVLGVFIGLLCQHKAIVLVVISVLMFAATLFLFFFFYTQYYISSSMKKKEEAVPEEQTEKETDYAAMYQLSERELEVFKLLLGKKTNAEIAFELHISENTVKFHVRNILKKAGCENRKELLHKIK